MADGIVKWGKSKKDRLTEEKNALNARIEELRQGGASEGQLWHMIARVEAIDKELAKLETPAGKFNMATETLNETMVQNQSQQLSPEQIMQSMMQKQAA